MGCNTSKESMLQNESDNKENGDASAEKSENLNSKSNDGKENQVNDTNEEKSLSARTITLRSSDERSPTKDNASAKSQDNSSGQQSGRAEKQGEKEEEQAATKIQAVFRGHKTRQSMKQPTAPPAKNEDTSGGNTTATNEPTREQLEEEFRLDDVELCHAATKIQASFRGHMTRKQEAVKKEEESVAENQKNDGGEELDIDLADPELNKAACKIQASFRGHMVRKENEGEDANSSK